MKNKKQKILLVCTQMEAGGVQTRAIGILKELQANGIEAVLLFLYKKRPSFRESENIFCLLDHRPSKLFEYIHIFYKLAIFFLKHRPLVVIGFAHYASQISSIYGVIFRCHKRIGTQTNPPSTMPRLVQFFDLACGAFGVYTDNIVPTHAIHNMFKEYPKIYKKKISVIYNGVPKPAKKFSKIDARRKLSLLIDDQILLSCGRLALQKNQEFLIRLLVELPSHKLIIIGAGELDKFLMDLAIELRVIDRVLFTGEVERKRLGLFFFASDIFLFPSHYEAFGLALVEAMGHGLPVISSDIPSSREVVSSAGILLPIDNQNAWAAAIENVTTNSHLYSKMQRASLARSRTFSFEKMFDSYYEIFRGK